MANEVNTGHEKLLAQILAEANDDASKTRLEGEKEAAAILIRGKKEIERMEAAAEQRMERAATDINERSRTNAELDARKHALEVRRTVVDSAFQGALEALSKLSGEQRQRLIEQLILQEAEGGESVEAASGDKALLETMINGLNAKLVASNRRALTVSAKSIDSVGGFILKSDKYHKNCTFEAIVRDLRTTRESDVAAILFA